MPNQSGAERSGEPQNRLEIHHRMSASLLNAHTPAGDAAAASSRSSEAPGAAGGAFRPTVLFVNRSYWPDAEATGQLLTELCEDLAPHFEVHVVAGQPNSNPTNEPFQPQGTEHRHDVTIHRVRHARFLKRSLAGRCLNQLTFFLAAFWTTLTIPRPDVVVVETDPFFLAFLGTWLKLWRRCRSVVYIQDIYPDMAVALGKLREGIVTRCLRRLLLASYRRADRIVVLSHDMREALREQGLCESHIETLPNWVDTARIVPVKRQNGFRAGWGIDDKFVVMYSGNMGLSQPLDFVLEAADALRDRPQVEFLLVGDGVARQRLQDIAQQKRLPNVRFLPYQPREELARSLSAADLHLVTVDPRAYRLLMPCKLYAILASGTPLAAIAPRESELSRTVVEQRVGLAVSPGDVAELTGAIRRALAHRGELEQMGQRARQLAVEMFDRRSATGRFQRLLSRVLCEGRPAGEDAVRPSPRPRSSALSGVGGP
jgi:glycosyltransferase involved in cell wall biosynthesis